MRKRLSKALVLLTLAGALWVFLFVTSVSAPGNPVPVGSTASSARLPVDAVGR